MADELRGTTGGRLRGQEPDVGDTPGDPDGRSVSGVSLPGPAGRSREVPVLRLLCSYLARGTVIKMSA
jgi:hypothetical protein